MRTPKERKEALKRRAWADSFRDSNLSNESNEPRITRRRLSGKRVQRPKIREEEKRRERYDKRLANQQPTLTAESAYEIAKLLAAGCPIGVACAFVWPKYDASLVGYSDDDVVRARWHENVARDRLTLDAVTKLNGAEWQNLPKEERLQIALDKHFAECAFVLYTNNYSTAENDVKRTMDVAAERLMRKIGDKEREDLSPMFAWVKEFIKSGGKMATAAFVPPDFEPSTRGKES